tara:strand:- start:523 stop:1527 length:1005 start_codon:yes stop_codon:yes gene_type:complete
MSIFVTGAAGYIGGTFAFEALKRGYKVIGCDNYINSKPNTIQKIKKLFPENFVFYEIDLKNIDDLKKVIKKENISQVVHFAALKSVPESEEFPEKYWKNNVDSTENLLNVMRQNNIKELIFSSSASVYGQTKEQPITEQNKLDPLSVYAKTKAASENLIKEISLKGDLKAISLRYFNPLGAHSDLVVYENPMTEFGNVMPKLLRVFLKIDDNFSIFGDDYDTRDGTGERDYLHISDLIEGHFLALSYLKNISNYDVFNLGTGEGITVLELLSAFEEVSGSNIKKKIKDKRLGDVDVCYSDPSKSNKILGWNTRKSLFDMCNDSIQAIKRNIDEL